MSWQPSVAASPGPIGPTGAAGAAGAAGNSVRHGAGAPGAGLGANGDYYIDETDPDAPVFYGPKAAGAWGSGVTLGGSLPLGDVVWSPDSLFIDAQVGDVIVASENGTASLDAGGGEVFINPASVPKLGGVGGGTTVGAAGAASPLPLTPARYLLVNAWNGAAYANFVIPLYTAP